MYKRGLLYMHMVCLIYILLKVIWRRDDGEQIMVHGKKAAVVESRRLNLPKISRLHMGDYMCVASNGIAPLATKKYRIRVQCKFCVC